MDRDEALRRIRDAFAAPEPPRGGEPPGASGVVVPLVPRADGLHVLFTRRSESLSSHAGEISFPGGRVDPGDRGPLGAALREAEEEVGVPAAALDVLGHVTDFVTFRGTLVCAYAAHVPEALLPAAPASPAEVEELLLVPLATLLAPDAAAPPPDRLAERVSVRRAVAYEGRALPGGPRERVVHYWGLAGGGVPVWGITGELLARFLEKAYAWTPPAAPRPIRSVAEYLP